MHKICLTTSLIFSAAFLSIGCSNISHLSETNFPTPQTVQAIPVKGMSAPVTAPKSAAMVIVNWQKIEAAADKKYEDEPLADYYLNILSEEERNGAPWFYAQDFNVSIEEAQRRLLLQRISLPLNEAISEQLGANIAEFYYDNNDPDEFSIRVTTLTKVKAVPPKYVYHFKQKEFENYSFPIYIQTISDKMRQLIVAIQEKAWPEVLKRYPDAQSIGFSPMTNTINVTIYRPTPNETERQRIEAELNDILDYLVMVEFTQHRITTL